MGEVETEQPSEQPSEPHADRENDGQEYLDRSQLDFDPDDGLYSGTAVDGTSDIPGPHEADGYSERGDTVELGENPDGDEGPGRRAAEGEDTG
ncbi:MAG TPA: hypothetical protein VGN35_09330 [Jatrophihabitantaceae bacterium]|jgi:hypothetical protein|nr:hypothetical protein [Jatrophihabitantaceae bacterium]